MDNPRLEKAASVYTQQLRHPITKKSFETSETLNDSLPNIQFSKTPEKVNVLRNQLNDTKSQVAIMESKLNNLRLLKQKNQSKNKHNLTKIQFMSHVKQRVRNDFEYKLKVEQRRQQQLGMLKQYAGELRESLVTERKVAENNLYTIKYNEAEEERQRKKHHQYLIKKLKELDNLETNRKVERVRQFHQESSSRIKEYQTSRLHVSRQNYQQKLISTLKQKERAKSMLQRLKQQQQKALNDFKASEQVMLTSLYSLETLNPQRKKKRFNSIDKTNKYDIDDYSNEEFEV